jgi:hypothetical protein
LKIIVATTLVLALGAPAIAWPGAGDEDAAKTTGESPAPKPKAAAPAPVSPAPVAKPPPVSDAEATMKAFAENVRKQIATLGEKLASEIKAKVPPEALKALRDTLPKNLPLGAKTLPSPAPPIATSPAKTSPPKPLVELPRRDEAAARP